MEYTCRCECGKGFKNVKAHNIHRPRCGTSAGGYQPEKILRKSNWLPKTSSVKDMLLSYDLKAHQCETCLHSKWNKKAIPLELHHINGDPYDNRLENLQLLCPNCHAQTDNYRSKNRKKLRGVAQLGQSARFGSEKPEVQILASRL